jgi:PBSX family phage terminase large subunit
LKSENVPEVYQQLYNLPQGTNTLVFLGGRGSGKTYQVSNYIAISATVYKKRCVVIRDEKALIKETILNEIWERYETANDSCNGYLDKLYIKNETELKDRKTCKTLIYTKGFRATDNKKKANLKGASDIDIAIIEEGEDIRDEEKFNTFVDSLRKEGCLVIIILNTPDIGHFLLKNYFNLLPTENDGYFQPEAKQLKGVVQFFTTYKDNKFLPSNVIERYEAYGNREDKHYYLTSILGLASSGRQGQVHKNFKPIKRADYMALPFKEYYGQDFGNPSPAALVGVKFDGQKVYCRCINYKPMASLELGKLYCTLGFTPSDKIIADNADALSIIKLRNGFKRQELTDEDIRRYPKLLQGFYVVGVLRLE